jgi:uracil-DNA glycosylase
MSEAAEKMEPPQEKCFPENLPPRWRELLKAESDQPYFKNLTNFLRFEAHAKKIIYPERSRILRALQLVDYDQVRVVILGQDPYHGPRQAVGLSFAVPNDLFPKPPSLQNIFKEISADLQLQMNPKASELTGWARQGVLLLNTALTVEAGQAFSHRNRGWETFTDKIIQQLSHRQRPIVFLLWGAAAHSKASLIDPQKHFILKAAHPSPLSASKGFFGCKHFSKTNEILTEKLHENSIDWKASL